MNCREKYILVQGASIIDIIGFSKGKFQPKDSIPGKIKMSFGGVCRNIAENLARVNINTEFVSAVGDDFYGKQILAHSKEIGYKMKHSLVVEGEATPTYMAILNEEGELEAAVVDLEIINRIDEVYIDEISTLFENAEYTILSANNPTVLEYILKKFYGKTKFILDPVSASKAMKIKGLIKYFHTIKPNRLEAEALCGFEIKDDEDLKRAAEYFRSLGVKNIFISLDADGIFYSTEEEMSKVVCAEKVEVKNVTGAGDSFVAGIGYGYMNGLTMLETVKFAIGMSIFTIGHKETINPSITPEAILQFISTTDWNISTVEK